MLSKKSCLGPCVICQFSFSSPDQYRSIQKCPSSSARFLCILLFLFAPKPTMIVALLPQVLFTHINLNILIKESDLDYILKFIVGEGNGFNRLGALRVLLVELAMGTEAGKHSPMWNWRCGSFQKSQKQLRDQTRISVSVRLNFRERWDFQEKWRKVTRDMSLHGSCGWLFFCRLSARASFHLNR